MLVLTGLAELAATVLAIKVPAGFSAGSCRPLGLRGCLAPGGPFARGQGAAARPVVQ